jgi:hypothetical protein
MRIKIERYAYKDTIYVDIKFSGYTYYACSTSLTIIPVGGDWVNNSRTLIR